MFPYTVVVIIQGEKTEFHFATLKQAEFLYNRLTTLINEEKYITYEFKTTDDNTFFFVIKHIGYVSIVNTSTTIPAVRRI